jgi:glutamate-1-semialdehyde 2,1-aminomutase
MTNAELFARSQRVIPGGVNSSIRAFKSVGGTPYLVARADGPYVVDVEGRRTSTSCRAGAVILGHAHPAITEAVSAAAAGTSYGAPTSGEMLLAGRSSARAVSGDGAADELRHEATSTALRLARGSPAGPGRDLHDSFRRHRRLARRRRRRAGDARPARHRRRASRGGGGGWCSAGNRPQLDRRVACVFVEPVAANMGVSPRAGFLEVCAPSATVSAVLVFDEVITGFRLGAGAQRCSGAPDHHVRQGVGGGLPIGAVGGTADHGDPSPSASVHAGAPAGNPLATGRAGSSG